MRKIPVKSSNPHFKRYGIVLLGLVLVIALLELTNTTHLLHKQVTTIGSSHPKASTNKTSSDKSSSDKSNSTKSDTSSSSSKNTAPAAGDSSGGAAPTAPSGTFVSNHHPSLSNQGGVPSQLRSVCVTTPGASCYIEFTKGNVVKKLDAQTTDSNGAAYWDWDVVKAGFDAGAWKVTAIATLNNQSIKSEDAQDLAVQP